MARRLEDVVTETEGMSPEEYRAAASRLERLEAAIDASRRGESRLVTLEELQPLLDRWRAEPPGSPRDWRAEMAALPWRTARERGWRWSEDGGE